MIENSDKSQKYCEKTIKTDMSTEFINVKNMSLVTGTLIDGNLKKTQLPTGHNIALKLNDFSLQMGKEHQDFSFQTLKTEGKSINSLGVESLKTQSDTIVFAVREKDGKSVFEQVNNYDHIKADGTKVNKTIGLKEGEKLIALKSCNEKLIVNSGIVKDNGFQKIQSEKIELPAERLQKDGKSTGRKTPDLRDNALQFVNINSMQKLAPNGKEDNTIQYNLLEGINVGIQYSKQSNKFVIQVLDSYKDGDKQVGKSISLSTAKKSKNKEENKIDSNKEQSISFF